MLAVVPGPGLVRFAEGSGEGQKWPHLRKAEKNLAFFPFPEVNSLPK